ncbi:LysR family transcriptional regulator [Streptomyces sp. NPDC052077]|uniref:LysR family transcriptional regulator n=1 Tax=Streptomyces sp. NPDC052077 TaxID=3154757 RepID=UPI00343923D5
MTLNLTHLVALRALCRLGTLAAVADELGYTPGAVSQQFAALEKAVGAPLIARVGRKVVLTDAGRLLAEHAVGILDAERIALDSVRSARDVPAGPILLGTFGSTAAALVPPVAGSMRRDFPAVDLRTCELDVDDVVPAVRRGRVDLALGLDYPNSPMRRSPDIEAITLHTERFGLAFADGAHAPASREISLREAREWSFVAPPESTPFGRAVRTACRQSGFEPRVRHEMVDTAVALVLAARGLGAVFVTDTMLALNDSVPLTRVDLTEPFERRTVLIRAAGAAARPAVRAVTDTIRTVVG